MTLETNEIEVTEEMIEAGATVIRTYAAYEAEAPDLAAMVFEAMTKARAAPRRPDNSPGALDPKAG